MKINLFNHRQSKPKAQKISKEEIEKTRLGVLPVNIISGCSTVTERFHYSRIRERSVDFSLYPTWSTR